MYIYSLSNFEQSLFEALCRLNIRNYYVCKKIYSINRKWALSMYEQELWEIGYLLIEDVDSDETAYVSEFPLEESF